MVDAEILRAVVDQVGTLVASHDGKVLSSSGELHGAAGETAAATIVSILQDAGNVLNTENKETLERLVVNFSTFDYVVTHDSTQVYIVKRVKTAHAE